MKRAVLSLWILAGACKTPAPPVFVFLDHLPAAEMDFDRHHFRSMRPDGRLSGQVTLGRETRQAILPPLPSRITYEVLVPDGAVLRFAVAVATLGEEFSPAPVPFEVHVDRGARGDAETVFETVVRRREPNRFLEHEVDLSRFAGSRVRLTFETGTEALAELPVIPYWANPVLVGGERDEAGAPDVVLISLDCVRADHLGAYGYERETSPRIDQFAKEAVVFENATAVSSFTHPTHMTMLTGLPPSIHGVSRWRKPDGSVPYLPEVLARAGYRASGIVSGPLLSQSFGFERGFHEYHAFHDETRAPALVDAALEMLRRGAGQPRFLLLHFFDAHWPYWPGDELATRFGPVSSDTSGLLHKVRNQIPPAGEEEVSHMRDLYDAELVYLDREVGRFLDELKKSGTFDDALIILTADHGEAFLEHGFWEHGQTLYQEMVHVPLIVKWPRERSPRRVASLVGQTDLFPTILEAAGIEEESEGYSLLRPRSGREVVLELIWDPRPDRPALMQVAWRGERYKYIAALEAPTVDDLYSAPIRGEELYDLLEDPEERIDLAKQAEEVTERSRRSVLDYLARARKLRGSRQGPEVEIDDELRQRLESLGYIER